MHSICSLGRSPGVKEAATSAIPTQRTRTTLNINWVDELPIQLVGDSNVTFLSVDPFPDSS